MRGARRRPRREPRSWLKSLATVLFVVSEWLVLVGNVVAQVYLI